MGAEVRHFTATIPAGTPSSAPVTIPISFPPRVVLSIYWRVPNGPMGTMGWQLSMGGVQVLPTQGNGPGQAGDTWVIANDENGTWTPEKAPDSGAWAVTGYNTGVNPHTVYLAFELGHPELPEQPPAAITGAELYPVPDLSMAGPPVVRRR